MEYAPILKKYRSQLFQFASVILTLIIVVKMFKAQTQQVDSLKSVREIEFNKNEILANISQLEKKVIAYKNKFEKKDLSLVINTISNIARDSNVKITSIKPKKEESLQAYMKFPFEMVVGADSYHVIAKFISKLENHVDILFFVDNATFVPGEQTGGKLTANLTISTIAFQN